MTGPSPDRPAIGTVASYPAAMPEPRPQSLTHEAFADLYARLGPRLLNFLTRQVGNPDLASDLLQETFLRILRSAVLVHSDPELSGYAFCTAHSVVMDHFRREQRARRWNFLAAWGAPVQREPSADMARVFGKLNPRDRSLLWLAYVEEMNHEEIAAALGVGARSVKVLLHRARKKLGDTLRAQNLGPEVSR